MLHLSTIVAEAVARKKTGKYHNYGEYLKKGDRVVLKTMEEIEKLPEFSYHSLPEVNGIVIWPFMQERLGGELTVNSTQYDKIEDQWFFIDIQGITWPVEVIDRLVS